MMEFYYLDDQWMIHFDLIENYKHVIVDLTLAGSEVMSFCDVGSAKLVIILYFLRGRYKNYLRSRGCGGGNGGYCCA